LSPAHAALKGGATTPISSPAKPFTQEQVSKMVQAGLGDDSGAKLIEQRGIDFAPAEDIIQSLKAAGASETFLNALRAARAREREEAAEPGAGFRPAGGPSVQSAGQRLAIGFIRSAANVWSARLPSGRCVWR